MRGGRACASQQAAEEERKERSERWCDTDILMGEVLCETGVGLIWIKAGDWLHGEKERMWHPAMNTAQQVIFRVPMLMYSIHIYLT